MTRFCYTSLLALCFISFTVFADAAVLAPDQSLWLKKNNNTLVVRPEKNYPPFSFVSSTPTLRPKGLAVDYLDLVARKIEAQPTYLEAKSRASILSDLKAGKEGIVLTYSETDERSEYLYFSEPFISIPVVIVTRKDFKHTGDLTLGDFTAKQVAITEGYAVQEYVKGNYQKIIIESVTDDEVALQKVLLGEVDAAIMDLASLSYYTSSDMLTYVAVVGQTGYEYELSFAVPKTMPELQTILNAGLKEITPAEREIIKDRWITFPSQNEVRSSNLIFFIGTPLWIGLTVVGGIVILLLLTIIIVHTRRHHRLERLVAKKHEKKVHDTITLTEELEFLEHKNKVLHEDIEEISLLEKELQEKIDQIEK